MSDRISRTLAVFAVASAFTGTAIAATRHGGAVSVAHSPRVCRSARTWDGTVPDRYRPCVRITAVQEDGSFSYAVSDADGTVRYTADQGALDR